MKSNISNSKINRKIIERDLDTLKSLIVDIESILKRPEIDEGNYSLLNNLEDSIRIIRSSFITRFIFLIRQGEEKID